MDGLERSRLVILWAGMGETALSFYQCDPGHGWQRNPFFIIHDLDMATSFMKKGIVDYLVKPVEAEKLRASVAKAMEQREIHRL